MKKNLLYLFALICSMSLFTACNNDNDPEYIQDGEFDGVYLGTLDVDAEGLIKVDDIPQKVYITKTGENQFKMELKNFSFQTLNLGTISVENIAVVKSGTSCTFTGSQKITLLVGECAVTVTGSIEGDKLDMDIAVLAGGTLNVKVDFEGAKLAADKSSEALIKTFQVKIGESDVEAKIGNDNTITFIIPDGSENFKFVPTIAISDKATMTPASGVEQDFSVPVTYTVTSEDGIVINKYIVSVGGVSTVYDMQTWVTDAGNGMPTPQGLANSNLAALFLPAMGIVVPTPVVKAADNAAEITTSRTVSPNGGQGTMVPGVTAGTLFVGKFDLDFTNTLKSTHFGMLYGLKPIDFKITYKYTPGADFYKTIVVKDEYENEDNSAELVAGETDKCSINAYLYEVSSDDETLDGTNINTSKKVILKAELADGSAKTAYTTETISFVETGNGKYDSTKKYKLAIVCSSSKRGDEFMGGDGSKLWVKYLEVIGK